MMNRSRHATVWLLLPAVLMLFAAVAAAGAAAVDNSVYADLLKKYVHNGVVDYRGLKGDEALLDRYLKVLEQVPVAELSRKAQFAFYINAYNAWTLKLILSGYPGVKSIKDLGSFFQSPWKKKLVRIQGKVLTLDALEHGILRPRFKDPRVHFAIVCASKSCPPLISVPYRADTLDVQLDAAAGNFINNPQTTYLEGDTLYVSKIFKWFADDFGGDVPGFVARYARPDLKKQLAARGKRLKIAYLDYDWSLNGR